MIKFNKAVSAFLTLAIMVSMFSGIIVTATPTTLADGMYTIGVEAWKESADEASMMASLLGETAILEVTDGQITATITFVDGTIMQQPAAASSITEVWPEYTTKPTTENAGSGIAGVAGTGTNTFTFALSTLDMPLLAMNRGSISVIRLKFDMDSLSETDDSGFIPGIYGGVGQGYDGNSSADIEVFVQTNETEIVKIFAGAHDQTTTFFNMAFNGAYGAMGIPAKVIENQSLEGVDVVSGATMSSDGIKQAIAAALENAKVGNFATPEETQEVPAVMWQAASDRQSMMGGMLGETAEVRRYGSEYTAVMTLGPVDIYGTDVNGNDAENIRTEDKDGNCTIPPITETYDESEQTKTLEVWLNEMKTPLKMMIYVVPMSSDQTVRLKLTFGVEKEALQASIDTANAKAADKNLYTEESYAPFETALNSANLINGDSEATQEQVDSANTALVSATNALVLKPRDRTATTLEQLIDYTTNAVNGDIIRIGADISANPDAEQSASKRLLPINASVTVYGDGHILDGANNFGFFDIKKNASLTLRNLIIKNACVYTNGNPQAGAAIYMANTGGITLDMADCIITGCLGLNGGAIYINKDVNVLMDNCALIGNSARTGGNIYIDISATGTLTNNLFIGAIPVLETTNSDVNFGGANGKIIVGENNIIGSVYSGYLPENMDTSSVILTDFEETDYTSESWTAFESAWAEACVITSDSTTTSNYKVAIKTAIDGLQEGGDMPDGSYTLSVQGWHETNDAASMMAPILDPTAGLEVTDGKYTVTLKFIKTEIMGVDVNGQTAIEFWPEKTASQVEAGVDSISGVYIESDESKTVTFELSTLDMPYLAINVGAPMNGIRTIRLKFDTSGLQEIITGDKTELEAKITEANAITRGSYTTSSWNAFVAALDAAKAVMAKENATSAEIAQAIADLATAKNGLTTGGGGTGSTPTPTDDRPSNGSYTIEIYALMENSNTQSMTNQFIQDRANLNVTSSSMTLSVVWKGTNDIHMNVITKLEYKNSSGNFVNVSGGSYNSSKDTYSFSVPVSNLEDDVYMRVTVSEGMSEPQVFRLVMDESTLSKVTSGGSTSSGGGGGTTTTDTTVTDKDSGMKVTAAKDVIPTDAVLKVEEVKDGENMAKANAAFGENSNGKVTVYDITLTSKGVEVQPDGKIKLQIPIPEGYDKTKLVFYRINDDGTKTEIPGKVEGDFYVVELDHFSLYALAETATATTTPAPGEKKEFTDTKGHWAEDFISFVVGLGLFNGISDDTFSPDMQMTRGMFVTILGRAAGVNAADYPDSAFNDVDMGMYYAPYVAWAAEKGLANGVGDNNFAPESNVTREQMAVILYNYAKFAGIDLLADAEVPEGVKSYSIKASALKENDDGESMTNQFFTETLTVTEKTGGGYIVTAVMHGTDNVTMDMMEEFMLKQADGTFVEAERTVDLEANTMTATFEVEGLSEATYFQVYVPKGMGEFRPIFRLVFDENTMTELEAAVAPVAELFADDAQISDWASAAVYAIKAAGYISGKGNNTYDPQGTATRAEAAKIFAYFEGYGE